MEHKIGRRLNFAAGMAVGSLLLLAGAARAERASITQPLSVQISPLGVLAVPPAVTLLPAGTAFAPFTGTLPISFRARTTPAGGGTITMQVTSDFVPAGGPSTRAGALTYVCQSATMGLSCAGLQTAGTSMQTPVLTLPPSACTGGGGPCSNPDPNSLEIQFILENDPSFQTGTYTAQVTFIISAL